MGLIEKEYVITPCGSNLQRFFINSGASGSGWSNEGSVDVVWPEQGRVLELCVVIRNADSPFEGIVSVDVVTGETRWPASIPTQLMAALSIVVMVMLNNHARVMQRTELDGELTIVELEYLRTLADGEDPELKLAPPRMEPHDGGVRISGIDGKQWVSFRDATGFDWSLQRLLRWLNGRLIERQRTLERQRTSRNSG